MSNRLLKQQHENAGDARRAGTLASTTMREFDALCLPQVTKLSPQQIRLLRKRNKLSQPVFAAYLNLSPSTIRQWENGDKEPSGASLKLLNIMRDKGIETLG